MTLTKKLKTINAIISRVIFTKNFLITFLYIYTLRFKLKVLPRGNPIPHFYKWRWILGIILHPWVIAVCIPKNYKPHYNSRLDSCFASKFAIGSSSKCVFDCGYSDIPFCNHFNKFPVQKVNSSQTTGIIKYYPSLYFPSAFWSFHYISPLDFELLYFFVA